MAAGPGTGEVQSIVNSRYPTWEYDLIRNLGGNPTNLPNTLKFLNLWSQVEAVTPSANNWIAVSQGPDNAYPLTGASGDLPGNKDNIATFPTLAAGVSGITEFLRNSTYIGNGKPDGLIATMLNPNSTVSDMADALPTALWGGDGQNIINEYNKQQGQPGQQVNTTIYAPTGVATGPGGATAGGGDTGFTQCKSSNSIIGGGGLGVHFNFLNACQAKAIVAGMLVGIGASVMIVGGILVVTGVIVKGPVGQAVAGGVTPLRATAGALQTAGGYVAGSLRSSRPNQPSQGGGGELFDGQRLSPELSKYRATYGDRLTRDRIKTLNERS